MDVIFEREYAKICFDSSGLKFFYRHNVHLSEQTERLILQAFTVIVVLVAL